MSDQKTLTPQDVRALLAKGAGLAAELRPLLEQLYSYNHQPGRPDWWRQIQKDGSASISTAQRAVEDLSAVLEHHLAEVLSWTLPGQPGFEALKEQAAFEAKLAAEKKGGSDG